MSPSRMGSNADEILGRTTITSVAESLGLKVRMRRCQAVWRKGKDFNVALNNTKGVWFDHVAAEGGGVLDLIMRVRDCSRLEALQWLSYLTGVPLYNPTPHERQAMERRLQAAEAEGRAFIEWRHRAIEIVRAYRDEHMDSYHNAVQYLLNYPFPEPGNLKYELAEGVFDTYWERVENADRCLDVLREAPASELLPVFRSSSTRSVAA